MAQKVIIDADPGIGDALAIVTALLDPELDVLAITSCAGRVSGEAATRNIHAIVEYVDPPKRPRIGASQAPLPAIHGDPANTGVNPTLFNGPNGLGDFEVPVAELHRQYDASKLLLELVRTYPDEIRLITLGPLTNLAGAMEKAPEFVGLLNGLYCMGGSLTYGGDATAAAEFNIFADPQAARMVLRSAATKTLIPLDITTRVVMTYEEFSRLPIPPHLPIHRLLTQSIPFAFRAQHEFLGTEGLPLPEVVAIAAVSQPRLFEQQGACLDVETSGELTTGMTVVDHRRIGQWKSNIEVLTDVDERGVLDYLANVLRQFSA